MMLQVTNQDKAAVKQFFTGNAAEYSKLFLEKRSGSNFGFRERLNLAVEMTVGISGRLLDCACGSGEITATILGSGRFTGATVVDLSPKMLDLARQRLASDVKGMASGQLILKSSDIFEFASQAHAESYDLIVCLGLIAHTGRLDEILAGLRGLLTPNGKILLQSTLLDHAGTKIVSALASERYYRRYGYRISYFRHQDIVQAVRKAGLEVASIRRFTFGFPFGDRVWAAMNFFLEHRMRNWARSHGAEALYLLQPLERQH
jgi:2-polyprenyl-3-methyl-5-hydroxy-6-metoxy-1,4-benzoquinol methylase